MRKVSVEKIEADMVLAKDVASTSGNVLLGKGTSLTPAMGRRLKNWGIFFVYVEGEEESEEKEAAVTVSPEEVRAEMEKKFEGLLEDPIMSKIFDAVFEYKVSKRGS